MARQRAWCQKTVQYVIAYNHHTKGDEKQMNKSRGDF